MYTHSIHHRTNRWEHNPDYRRANNGMGMCNTGANAPGHCYLGGIGCDVDHVMVALGLLREDVSDIQAAGPGATT